MDILKPTNLKSLLAQQGKWSVSLYMPMRRMEKDQQQNIIRLKNLLAEAETKLLANGLRRPRVQGLMHPAEELLWNTDFWRPHSDGLAIFLSNDFHVIYRLPAVFDELLFIAGNFYVRPLFPLLGRDGKFYILAINSDQARLFQSNADAMAEIELNVPTSLEDALPIEEPQRSARLHPESVGRQEVRGGAGMPHEHSETGEPGENTLHIFRSINESLNLLLEDQSVPMVLAGTERLVALYREANTYSNLLDEAVTGDADRENITELREQAWNLVQPMFEEYRKKFFEKYQQLRQQASGLATNDIATTAKAARLGRVEALFIPRGEQVWGRYDESQNEAIPASSPGPGNENLLDLAASETLLNSGQVFAVPRDLFPGEEHLAAILRESVPGS